MKIGFDGHETRSEENGNTYIAFCGSLKERDSLEDLAVDGTAIFKINLKKHTVRRKLNPYGSGRRERQAFVNTVMNFWFT